jgi:hypothetical protein
MNTIGVKPPISPNFFFPVFIGSIILAYTLRPYFPDSFSKPLSIFHHDFPPPFLFLFMLPSFLFYPTARLWRKYRCTKCGSKYPVWTKDSKAISSQQENTEDSNTKKLFPDVGEIVPVSVTGAANEQNRKRVRYKAVFLMLFLSLPFCMFIVFPVLPLWLLPFSSFIYGLLAYWFLCKYDGWKNDVLYLRRFHIANGTDWVTSAVETLAYKNYRFITLDGNDLQSIKERSTTGRYSHPAASYVLVPLFITIFFSKESNLYFDTQLSFILRWGVSQVFLIIALLYSVNRFRGRQLPPVIDSYQKLDKAADQMQSERKWYYAVRLSTPPLRVIKVADDFWKDTVLKMSSVSDFIIIDLSVPSSALLWEIENADNLFKRKIIFIAHKYNFQNWVSAVGNDTNGIKDETSQSSETILGYISGKKILLYDQVDTFTKSLIQTLDNQARDSYSLPLPYNPLHFLVDFFGKREILKPK